LEREAEQQEKMAGIWQREVLGMTFSQFMTNIVIAVVLIIVGIVLGQIVRYIFKRILEKAEIRSSQRSFVELFLTAIKWGIYILFINLALIQLNIPQFTDWITPVLAVIPALIGALLLIGVGFAIASYLKEVIEDSRISGWETLSRALFFFVNYIFLVFAFKTALMSIDKSIVNYLLLILSGAVAFGVAYKYARKR